MKIGIYIGVFFTLGIFSYFLTPASDDSSTASAVTVASMTDAEWNAYWYSGKAEVSSYNLSQSRYGQTRSGKSVLVFVTEDFSKSKQVKLDYPNQNPNDKVSVMKTNMIRKFNTGIYDYSMMASVFTPISADRFPNTLKVSSSSQEWCGHTWTQYNRVKNGYQIDGKSYFESEGDEKLVLQSDLLEDEIWNRLRINPEQIPTGEINIIPGSFYSRLAHVPFKVEKATMSREEKEDSIEYELNYKSIKRTLTITIDKSFPHKILNWKESTNRGTTEATLTNSLHIPYWQMNGNEYEVYRDSLGL